MKKTIIQETCDYCGREDVITNPVYIDYDRRNDAAGQMENLTITFDVCIDCALKIISKAYHYRPMSLDELKAKLRNFEEC